MEPEFGEVRWNFDLHVNIDSHSHVLLKGKYIYAKMLLLCLETRWNFPH